MILETDIESLKAENAYYKDLLTIPQDSYPKCMKLTGTESIILTYLRMARGFATSSGLKELIESRSKSNIERVYICRLNKKLSEYGIAIENVYGMGYRIEFKNRKKLNDLIAELLGKE